MRKKYILTVLLLTALVLSAGCGKETGAKAETETLQSEAAETEMVADVSGEPETLETETEILEEETENTEEAVLYRTSHLQTTRKAEVSLDDMNEKHIIEVHSKEQTLCIDEKEYPLDETWECWTDDFLILDINVYDDLREIGVLEKEAFGGFRRLGIYRYKEGTLKYIGSISAGFLDAEEILFDGRNHIYVPSWQVDVEQSNLIVLEYTITEDEKLEIVEPEEGYWYMYRKPQQLLENLPVYAERDHSLEPYYIAPQEVTFLRTDRKNWVEVLAEDGTKGWLYIEQAYKIPDLGKETDEVFEGLAFCN